MGYVVYDADTTKLLTGKVYQTTPVAKAAITRELKRLVAKGKDISTVELTYTDVDTYYEFIERKVERVNMMSGKTYWESINTPSYCSPASEAYWSA
jgi:hypothetical protein